jgi:hypothetical protein
VIVLAANPSWQAGARRDAGLLHWMEADIRTPAYKGQAKLVCECLGQQKAARRLGLRQGWRLYSPTAERMNVVRQR